MPSPTKPARAWQRMLSGRRLDLLDPSPLDIEIEDIARGISRVARWNGQTSGDHAFSVAEHSVLVEAIFGRLYPEVSCQERMKCLLHDAPEYVIGDMISPFKSALGLDYKAFEARLEEAIHLRFGLQPKTSKALHRKIKHADGVSAYLEATQIAGFTVEEADQFFLRPPEGLEIALDPMSVAEAEAAFLWRFGELERDCAAGS